MMIEIRNRSRTRIFAVVDRERVAVSVGVQERVYKHQAAAMTRQVDPGGARQFPWGDQDASVAYVSVIDDAGNVLCENAAFEWTKSNVLVWDEGLRCA